MPIVLFCFNYQFIDAFGTKSAGIVAGGRAGYLGCKDILCIYVYVNIYIYIIN